MQFDQLSKIIVERRSVFPQFYNNTPIADETIKDLLALANWAPTHKKTEPWRWKVIKGDGLQRLSGFLANHYKATTAAEKHSEIKLKKTAMKPLQSQAVIAICMHNDPQYSIPEWEELAAVAMAVQNMWLACTALSIGSYWSSPASAMAASDFLDLGPHEKCLGWFYMGYYDTLPIEGQRQSSEDKTTWITK